MIGYGDAEFLLSITKDDILQFFNAHIDPQSPTRAKLSVHMVSEKHRVKRVSETASHAFEEKARLLGVDTNELNWRQAFPDGLPALTEFTEFWRERLAGQDYSTNLLGELTQLVAEHPIEGEDTNPTIPQATYVSDAVAFKQGLGVSVDPGAMVQWGDLPTPKF